MVRHSTSFARLFLYSHLFLAACAGSLVGATQLLVHGSFSFSPAFWMAVSATVVYYNFHKFSYQLDILHPVRVLRRVLASDVHWVDRLLTIIGSCTFLYFAVRCNVWMLTGWLLAGLLAVSYSLPLLKLNGKVFRIRESPLLKLSVLSFVWTLATVVFPLAEMNLFALDKQFIWISLVRFLFVFSLCIPFEIRDASKEKARGVKSLMDLGMGKVRLIALTTVMMASLVLWIAWNNGFVGPSDWMAHQLCLVIAGYYAMAARPDWPRWIFKAAVDGTMALLLIFIILFRKWL